MAKRGMGSNLNYDGENADFEEFYKAFGYDAAMYGWDKVQQAHVIQYCLSGKALRTYNSMSEQERKIVDRVFEELKATCFKPTEYYLNLFYGRTLNSGESMAGFAKDLERLVDKGLPGLDGTVRTKLLKSRLISSVPENTKNFLELLSDKSWKELITIFENQVDYKSIVPSQFSQEITINKMEQRQGPIRSEKKFTGTCNYCSKPGHKWFECRKRMLDVEKFFGLLSAYLSTRVYQILSLAFNLISFFQIILFILNVINYL